MKIKAIIFDFDGTIANTLPYTFEKIIEINRRLKVTGKKDEEIIKKIREMDYRQLMREFKVSWLKIPLIIWEIKKAQKELYKKIEQIKAFKGIEKLIIELKKKGVNCYIYSSNIKKNIEKFLEINNLKTYFKKIYTGSNLLGKDKDLLFILKKEGLKREEVFYVADEVRDVLACQKAKIRIIAVSWGLNSPQLLKKTGALFIIKKPEEILKFLG